MGSNLCEIEKIVTNTWQQDVLNKVKELINE